MSTRPPVVLAVAVLVGALLGGVSAGWIGVPVGGVILPLVVLAAITVRRERRRKQIGR